MCSYACRCAISLSLSLSLSVCVCVCVRVRVFAYVIRQDSRYYHFVVTYFSHENTLCIQITTYTLPDNIRGLVVQLRKTHECIVQIIP